MRRQSEHIAEYARVLDGLIARELVYRCFLTRREIAEASANAPHELGEVFRGEALAPEDEAERLERGEAFAWRLSLKKSARGFGAGLFRFGVRG